MDRRGLRRRRRRRSCRWARRPTSGRTAISRPASRSAALVLDETFVDAVDRPPAARNAHGDGLLAERQAVPARLDAEHGADASPRSRAGSASTPDKHRADQRVHRRRLRQQDSRRDLDGDSGAAVEEGQRAGDDAHQPRGRALHRPRAAGHASARVKVGFAQGRPHHRARHVRRRRQRSVRAQGDDRSAGTHGVAGLPAAGDALARRRRC